MPGSRDIGYMSVMQPPWPREHGAYAQLLLPLAAALPLAGASLANLAYATGAVATFMASEPARRRLGERGPRAVQDHPALHAWLALWLALAVASATFASLAQPPTRALGGLGLAVVLSALAATVTGHAKSLPGEIAIGSALASPSLWMAGPHALAAWWAWSLGFAAMTGAARAVKPRAKRYESVVATLAVVATVGSGWLDPLTWCALPMAAVAGFVVAFRPSAKHLRKIGWGFAAASTVCAGSLVALGARS